MDKNMICYEWTKWVIFYPFVTAFARDDRGSQRLNSQKYHWIRPGLLPLALYPAIIVKKGEFV